MLLTLCIVIYFPASVSLLDQFSRAYWVLNQIVVFRQGEPQRPVLFFVYDNHEKLHCLFEFD